MVESDWAEVICISWYERSKSHEKWTFENFNVKRYREIWRSGILSYFLTFFPKASADLFFNMLLGRLWTSRRKNFTKEIWGRFFLFHFWWKFSKMKSKKLLSLATYATKFKNILVWETTHIGGSFSTKQKKYRM